MYDNGRRLLANRSRIPDTHSSYVTFMPVKSTEMSIAGLKKTTTTKTEKPSMLIFFFFFLVA